MKLIYILEYVVFFKPTNQTFKKFKIFESFEQANEFQLQYNGNWTDRKIIHYDITPQIPVESVDALIKKRGDRDK